MKRAPVVICSEVLEHLPRYKEALKNLLSLTGIRLIFILKEDKNDKCRYYWIWVLGA